MALTKFFRVDVCYRMASSHGYYGFRNNPTASRFDGFELTVVCH